MDALDLDQVAATEITSVADFDYLKSTGRAAESNKFLMTGKALSSTLAYGEDVTVDISVSRVVAKLDERTKTDGFPLTWGTSESTSALSNAADVTIDIVEYSYSNMAPNSFAFQQAASLTAAPAYLQPYAPAGTADIARSYYKWVSTVGELMENGTVNDNPNADEGSVSYVYENFKMGAPTRVHYTGNVVYDGEALEDRFYVWSRFVDETHDEFELAVDGVLTTLYPTWEDLCAAATHIPDIEPAAELDENEVRLLEEFSVKTFHGGLCYYEAVIGTATGDLAGDNIVRNNWYVLSVKTIADLGTPYPVKEDPQTTNLTINANIEPWIININDLDL
jgi:hypothetical protein